MSFTVRYDYLSSITYGIAVIADNPDKVQHDKAQRKFRVTHGEALEMNLSGKGL